MKYRILANWDKSEFKVQKWVKEEGFLFFKKKAHWEYCGFRDWEYRGGGGELDSEYVFKHIVFSAKEDAEKYIGIETLKEERQNYGFKPVREGKDEQDRHSGQ